jgi:hypothetical protein
MSGSQGLLAVVKNLLKNTKKPWQVQNQRACTRWPAPGDVTALRPRRSLA